MTRFSAILIALLWCLPCWADIPSSGYASATVQDDPGGDLSDFTLLVDLSTMPASWWSAVDTSDATKGRASKSDGTTELAVDWIDFDDVAETGFARILYTGTLASAGGNSIRIYPPQSANSSYAVGATFGQHNSYDASWEGYWPLHDLNDRTSNGLTLTASGAPTSGVTGQLGDAYSLDGTGDWFTVSQSVVTAAPMTVMAWANLDNSSSAWAVASVSDDSRPQDQFASLADTTLVGRWSTRASGGFADALTSNSWSTGAWHHFVGVEESTTSRRAHLDGGAAGTNGDTRSPTAANSFAIGVLGDSSPGNEMPGDVDDVQLHSVARSADWIVEEYSQTNDNATFWGAWTWNSPGGVNAALLMQTYRRAGF